MSRVYTTDVIDVYHKTRQCALDDTTFAYGAITISHDVAKYRELEPCPMCFEGNQE